MCLGAAMGVANCFRMRGRNGHRDERIDTLGPPVVVAALVQERGCVCL